MTLNIDTQRRPRSMHEWTELVHAIGQAPDDTVETSWLELKGPLDLTTAKDRFKVAKAILGFANRDPLQAGGYLDGCALLVIGVGSGTMPGTKRIEDHELIKALEPYLGRGADAPRWEVRRHHIDEDNDVLIVVVDAPQFGDPVYPLRKTFDKAWIGTVYARPSTETEPADDLAIDMLSRRSASPASEFSLTVTLNDDAIGRARCDTKELDLVLDKKVREWLRPLEPAPPSNLGLLSVKGAWDPDLSVKGFMRPALNTAMFGPITREEKRSADEFRAELDAWREKCRKRLPLLFQNTAALAQPQAKFTITNTCGQFLEDVEINVHIEGNIWGCDVPFNGAQPMGRVPNPPRPWGPWTESPVGSSIRALRAPMSSQVTPKRSNRASFRNGGSVDVTLNCAELRPGARVELEDGIAFVCIDQALEHTRVTVSATARGVHELFKTEFTQPISAAKDLTANMASFLTGVQHRE